MTIDTIKISELDDAGALTGYDLMPLRRPGVGVFQARLSRLASLVQALFGGQPEGLATLGASVKLADSQVPSVRRLPEWQAFGPEEPAPASPCPLILDDGGLYAMYPQWNVSTHGAGFLVIYEVYNFHATYIHASAGEMWVVMGAANSTVVGLTTTVLEATDGFIPFLIGGADTDPPQECIAIDRSGTQIGHFIGTGSEMFRLSGKGKRCTIERVSSTLFVVNGDVELPPP